jgi:N-methylhydantoinase A
MVTGRQIDGQPLRLPTLDIETISAGGGSIAHVDLGGALRVGPQSAGAEPGPACYGQGGTDATVTDAAVVLGILHPGEFLGGEIPLDADLARQAVQNRVAEPLGLSLEAAALGIVRVANAGMIQAIRKLSVERGLDIRDFALLAFGGAGPIYAPFMARDLDMAEVLVPLNPGVYAAQGLLMSDIRHTTQTAFQRRFLKVEEAELSERLNALKDELDQALGRDGIAAGDRRFRFLADMRCSGQFHELLVPLPEPGADGWWRPDAAAATFHEHHEQAYGHTDPDAPVEFVNLRVEGYGRTAKAALPSEASTASGTPAPASHRPVCLDAEAGFHDTPVYRREDLEPGHVVAGPAVIIQRDTTTVVLAGQQASVAAGQVLRIGAAS